MSRYRVDNVPVAIRPLYLAIMALGGLAIYAYFLVCHLTCRIRFEGEVSALAAARSRILCLWHKDWWSYFAVRARTREPQAMMAHPAAYMGAMYVAAWLTGIRKFMLGSEREEGRRAADQVVDYLRRGFSTSISPDGPAGPPRVLKKGALHLAWRSGAPIVPLTFEPSRSVRVKSWDSRRIPLPFATIRVIVHPPVTVEDGDLKGAAQRLVAHLA